MLSKSANQRLEKDPSKRADDTMEANFFIGEFQRDTNHNFITRQKRHRFFDHIVMVAPGVLKSLRRQVYASAGDALPIDWSRFDELEKALGDFKRRSSDPAARQLSYLWGGILMADEDNYAELIPVRERILKWSLRWHLDTNWCRDAILQTVNEWSLGRVKFNEWQFPGYGHRVIINREYEQRLVPSPLFPPWRPFDHKKTHYLNELERTIRKTYKNDPILSVLPKSYLESDVKALLQTAREYCKILVKYYESHSYRRIIGRPQEDKHFVWAVQVQILGMSISEVASNYGTDAANVSRRVREILRRIDLPLRKDIVGGRPKGSKNSNFRRIAKL
jgi:hypothetical protein